MKLLPFLREDVRPPEGREQVHQAATRPEVKLSEGSRRKRNKFRKPKDALPSLSEGRASSRRKGRSFTSGGGRAFRRKPKEALSERSSGGRTSFGFLRKAGDGVRSS